MTAHTNTPDPDDGYALDLTGPVQHIVAELGKAAPSAVSLDDLAAGYTHFAGDLARVRKHEGLASDREATAWLIGRAVDELTLSGARRGKVQLAVEDDRVSLAPGVSADDLKWRSQPVYSPLNIHQVLGDPFNPMSGRYAENVRKNTGKDDLTDLKLSMRALGWLRKHPAVKDARTGVTISGHRRLRAAAELRAEGVDIPDNIEYENFELNGEGDPADVARMDEALGSNFGHRVPTPEERAETALYLSEKRNMTQQQIAKVLGVSQQTVSRDLTKIVTQMGSELEPLIAAAQAAIHRGLTQSQFGVERNMANNSMMLAKAFAVAQDRIRREAEAEAAANVPPTTSDAVRDAIREGEEAMASGGPKTTPETASSPRQERQGLEDIEDPEPDLAPDHVSGPTMETQPAPAPRPAVNPPQDLPTAPQPYAPQDEASQAYDQQLYAPQDEASQAYDQQLYAPQDEASQAYDQQLDDWSWNGKSQRWMVQRGTAWITVRLPQDTPPAFPAHLFGVQLASEMSRGE